MASYGKSLQSRGKLHLFEESIYCSFFWGGTPFVRAGEGIYWAMWYLGRVAPLKHICMARRYWNVISQQWWWYSAVCFAASGQIGPPAWTYRPSYCTSKIMGSGALGANPGNTQDSLHTCVTALQSRRSSQAWWGTHPGCCELKIYSTCRCGFSAPYDLMIWILSYL